MLEDLGNCVKIHDTVIPAVNIQVDPQEIFRYDHEIDMWIGLYFEIMFEDGSLWVVTQEWPTDEIKIDWFPNWHKAHEYGFSYTDGSIVGIPIRDWDHFSMFYKIRLEAMKVERRITWTEFYKEMVV